ncbi:angiotensin-converting enzyme-like [Eupeodes corollae]|uniref:angiotensin-converting enzyme-like n=1 Tax=Eupeodes corollae TaxID=290404 RepID=UPI00248FC285|nr:angiotensin-converting enzyme-like [Eupeodes corollae]
MIERIFLNLALFTVIALAICNGKSISSNSNEEEAKVFLKETSDELFKFFDQVGDSYYRDHDNSYDQRESYKNYTIVYTKIFEDAQKFDYKNFKDPELKFAFETLIKEADLKIVGDQFLEILDSVEEMKKLEDEEIIPDYHDKTNKLAFDPDVASIMESTDDPEELQHYWSEWRKLIGEKAAADLDLTVEACKAAAEKTGKTPLEFWMRGYNLTDMESLMNEVRPLYSELHAFIRNLVGKKYGESYITPEGLLPIHLYEQIHDHLASNNSIIEEMFPYDELPDVEIDEFEATPLVKIVEEMFVDMGFEKFPEKLWGDRIIESNNEKCSVSSWPWTTNIFLEYCEEMDYSGFITLYDSMAYILYAKEMTGLPAYYFNHPNHLGTAIAYALHLSASTTSNLKSIGMIKDMINDKVEMNRLARSGILALLNLPQDFVHSKVMADLLSGNITKAELNDHYWKLMEKYAGVSPPKGHHTDTFDLPLYFYDEIRENDMTIDFTSQIMAFQIYEKLCELAGKYPKEPLHLCDLNGSKEVGNALKKTMKLGYSKPFYVVYGTLFPENPTVQANGILDFYKPLKKLLEEKNKEANIKAGWKSSD